MPTDALGVGIIAFGALASAEKQELVSAVAGLIEPSDSLTVRVDAVDSPLGEHITILRKIILDGFDCVWPPRLTLYTFGSLMPGRQLARCPTTVVSFTGHFPAESRPPSLNKTSINASVANWSDYRKLGKVCLR